MSLDEQGFLWISDPSIAIVAAIGLLLWCHLRLARADIGQLGVAPVRAESTAPVLSPGSTSHGMSLRCRLAGGRERRDAQRRRVA